MSKYAFVINKGVSMNKVAQYYRELVSSLTARLERGERDIDTLVESARQRMLNRGELTRSEIDDVTHAVRRDLEEFARSYTEQRQELGESVFMRVIRQSLWKELADITDKSQLEWREVFQDLNHHGVYHSGEVVGLGNLVCEQCQFTRAIYTPEVLTRCPQCGQHRFARQPFEP
nr:zinc ribbon-containing protein [Erwinia amylovora]